MSDETPRPSDGAADLIIKAWRAGRPIVPFLGAGISLSAGFPTIRQLTEYLAKVIFAIEVGIYESRYPVVVDGIDRAYEKYTRRPADFITDFGWPDLRQLNADVWRWINLVKKTPEGAREDYLTRLKRFDITSIETPPQAIKAVLRQRLLRTEGGLKQLSLTDVTLNGDWSDLLFHLTEGHLDLVDALFTGLDRGRQPTSAHVSLAFLTQLMGIRLILSVNFDTLLERTMAREGIPVRPFDIHRDADLPHPTIVAQQPSLIKLHGSAYGLRFGERLNYSLEEEAEHRIHEYLANDALMVVIGFSGGERRMMQIIESFARRGAGPTRPQVLWLDVIPLDSKGVSEALHRMEVEFTDGKLLHALQREQFCDANSFLSGLLGSLSNGFPSCQSRYPVLPSRPRLPWRQQDLGLPHDVQAAVIVLSEFALDKPFPSDATPSSWASFLAAEYAASKQTQRDIIWVDLENHHTVEGVVKDILRQIRNVDPTIPQLFLPAEDDREDDFSLQRATSRLRAAMLRSRFLIIFDSIESFSRPQLVHHGMPSHFTNGQQQLIKHRLHRLGRFLQFLTDPRDHQGYITPELQSTIVVLTSTILATRHSSPSDDFVSELNEQTRAIAKAIGGKHLSRNDIDQSYIGIRRHKHIEALTALNKELPAEDAPSQVWATWANDAVALRQKLAMWRSSLELNPKNKALFLAFLSILRRPRPRPLVGCMISRWLFDPGGNAFPLQLADISTTIKSFLNELHSNGYIEFLEGGTIWIPRAIKEEVYRRISAPLRLSISKSRASWPAAVIAGLLISTWHLQAARVYFADIYIPTHDDQAFFEYVYHRVAGLRYLAMIQSLLGQMGTADLAAIDALLKQGTPLSDDVIGQNADADGDAFGKLYLLTERFRNLRTFIFGIGAFSFVRRDPELRNALNATKRISALQAIRLAVWYSRMHGIVTLENALQREQDRISATTSPDTWLGWIEQLLQSELFYIFGEWEHVNEARGIVGTATLSTQRSPTNSNFRVHCEKLSRTLKVIRVKLLRRKFDYESATKDLAAELWKTQAASQHFVESMTNWVMHGKRDDHLADNWYKMPIEQDSDYLSIAERQADFLRAVSVRGSSDHMRELADELCVKVSGDEGTDRKARNEAELHLLQFRCEQRMNQIPMWDQTPRAIAVRQDPNTPSELRKSLIRAEQITHQLEDLYRQVAGSSEEYAVHRSRALTWRARCSYLRGQFREAHRTLNLASSDLSENSVSHRFARAVVDMYRAELLWISSSEHLLQDPGASAASIRKVETGISCLDTATAWLEPGVHRPTWWIRLHLGRALLRHDQLVLEILRSFSGDSPRNESYARRSAWLETCVLDGLRSLRVAFDTLPFNHRDWAGLDPRERKLGPKDANPDDKPGILNIEIALIQAWLKLFVAAFGAHHILLGKLQLPSLAVFSVPSSGWNQYYQSVQAQVTNLKDHRIIPLAELLEVHGFWRQKWVPWCEMLQFHRFAKDSNNLFLGRDSLGSQLILPLGTRSQHHDTVSAVRGYNILMDVIQNGRHLSENEAVVETMWNSRRRDLGNERDHKT